MFFTQSEQHEIVEAIKAAELETSGEVKLHVEKHCPTDNPMERAQEVFFMLALDNTALRNGVLFYLALEDRKFAILGDSGIDAKVDDGFWNEVKETLISHFKTGEYVKGLKEGIEKAGLSLKAHFPYQSDDINELSDDISFGDDE
ncbi:TPM domain-containing protein [Marinilongibacter aquaticus]|uniref:TPM domain-containing protein n=1 Tax=Marinilongibacter aquaticus TaxID=2975157 RepID=UPI0021BDD86D|nr:TPM domain-containing protein [Marinilongibacter aquaticus]UBM60448.1 TPM domain-containing protein [Marinilongibacter aquaticus]